MPTVVRWLLIAGLLTVLPIGAGILVADGGSEEAAAPAEYESRPLASYNTSTVAVARAGFCERLPAEAVAEALDGEPTREGAYGNGDRTALLAGVRDVAHEYGCRYAGAGPAAARAWVFAPPVTRARARDLAASAAEQDGCTRATDAPRYGAPGVALVCASEERRTVSFRGLFGDAWLACSVTAAAEAPERELVDRAGRWCVAVAEAASIGG